MTDQATYQTAQPADTGQTDPRQADPRLAARNSYSGRTATDGQFEEAWAIAKIIHGEINRSGSFHEKLIDYSHAYSRNERFDANRGEAILRDIYKGRYGETMNATRERLIGAEEHLSEAARGRALTCAETIGDLIQQAPTQPFYQAYDRAATTLANEFSITLNGAKAVMKDVFQAKHGTDLYEHGKQIEDAYHRPVREAEIAQRKVDQLQSRSQSRSRS